MLRRRRFRRPLAFGLAAAMLSAASVPAAEMKLEERIAVCTGCHGADGNSQTEKIPSLAGQPEYFLLDTLIYMREGVRPNKAMAPFVKSLSDEEITALAKHFADLPAKSAGAPPDPALVARGKALAERLRCASCHLPSLAGQEQIPRIAGQRIDYMISVLTDYRDGRRKGGDSLMSATVFGLADADLHALAHYAAAAGKR